ncbi:MAG: hypothetical protein COA79_13660 [Planctomycetota bacterium]|nr:MAG: hypothetical protein COA79_13660 [Planctomycetota bacterium]
MVKNKKEDDEDEYEYEYYTPRNYLSIFLAIAIPLFIVAAIAVAIIADFYSSKPAIPFEIDFPENPKKNKIGSSGDYNFEHISMEDGVKFIIFQREQPYPYLSLFYSQKKKFKIINTMDITKLLKIANIKDSKAKVIYKDYLQRDEYLCSELKIKGDQYMWCRVYYWRGEFIIVAVIASEENKVNNNKNVARFFNSLQLK